MKRKTESVKCFSWCLCSSEGKVLLLLTIDIMIETNPWCKTEFKVEELI